MLPLWGAEGTGVGQLGFELLTGLIAPFWVYGSGLVMMTRMKRLG